MFFFLTTSFSSSKYNTDMILTQMSLLFYNENQDLAPNYFSILTENTKQQIQHTPWTLDKRHTQHRYEK